MIIRIVLVTLIMVVLGAAVRAMFALNFSLVAVAIGAVIGNLIAEWWQARKRRTA